MDVGLKDNRSAVRALAVGDFEEVEHTPLCAWPHAPRDLDDLVVGQDVHGRPHENEKPQLVAAVWWGAALIGGR
nr:hypothetical protein [Pseudothauera rhizosphaerae]